VRVAVLGPLEVRDEAGNLMPVSGTRLRSLLIRLAIGDGRPVSVERLAGDLWEGDGPADGANAIQALVSRVRAAAGRILCGARHEVRVSGQVPDRWIDLR